MRLWSAIRPCSVNPLGQGLTRSHRVNTRLDGATGFQPKAASKVDDVDFQPMMPPWATSIANAAALNSGK